jgi:hypothetical protein
MQERRPLKQTALVPTEGREPDAVSVLPRYHPRCRLPISSDHFMAGGRATWQPLTSWMHSHPFAGVSPYRASSPSAPGLLSAGRAPIPAFHLLPDRWRGIPTYCSHSTRVASFGVAVPPRMCENGNDVISLVSDRSQSVARDSVHLHSPLSARLCRCTGARRRVFLTPRPPPPSPIGCDTSMSVWRWRGGEIRSLNVTGVPRHFT